VDVPAARDAFFVLLPAAAALSPTLRQFLGRDIDGKLPEDNEEQTEDGDEEEKEVEDTEAVDIEPAEECEFFLKIDGNKPFELTDDSPCITSIRLLISGGDGDMPSNKYSL
jgi:hypothetical protein